MAGEQLMGKELSKALRKEVRLNSGAQNAWKSVSILYLRLTEIVRTIKKITTEERMRIANPKIVTAEYASWNTRLCHAVVI